MYNLTYNHKGYFTVNQLWRKHNKIVCIFVVGTYEDFGTKARYLGYG